VTAADTEYHKNGEPEPGEDGFVPYGERHTVRTPASEIKMRAVRWLWEDKIPQGEITPFGWPRGIGEVDHCLHAGRMDYSGHDEGSGFESHRLHQNSQDDVRRFTRGTLFAKRTEGSRRTASVVGCSDRRNPDATVAVADARRGRTPGVGKRPEPPSCS
jgi:hypothetical protein